MLSDADGTGAKSWVINNAITGHIGVGYSGGDGTEWWHIQPDEWSGNGVYDDVLTFYADGTFQFDPGEGETVYVSQYVTLEPYSDYNEGSGNFQAPIDGVQTSDYSFNEYTINFPEGTLVTYIPNDNALLNPIYEVVSLTDDELILIIDNGIETWRFVFMPKP